VRYIDYDEFGQMDVVALDRTIEQDLAQGYIPFMVNSTAGTTVLGSFDPIDKIAKVCKKHQIWLHVDGAYCGSVIFSNQYKRLVKGLEQSDSFSYNAHKMLGTPLSCSIILTKHQQALYDSFSNDADYLYQTDRDDYNLGKTSLQCGRRNDALKFWTLWKSIGRTGLGELVDKQFELANEARDYVENHPDYTLYSYPDSVSVCFNYKNIPAAQLCTKLYEQAELMVGFGQFNDIQFVRLVTINYNNNSRNIIDFFERLEQFAEQEILPSTQEV
jgi:glutamate/tyrosine decarboxylase-like PLP-dependent enzyme